MPATCAVIGCRSRGSLYGKVNYFRLPRIRNPTGKSKAFNELSIKRLNAWLVAIKQVDMDPRKIAYSRVCSRHFISGRSAKLCDELNQDWVPSINIDDPSFKIELVNVDELIETIKPSSSKAIDNKASVSSQTEISMGDLYDLEKLQNQVNKLRNILTCFSVTLENFKSSEISDDLLFD